MTALDKGGISTTSTSTTGSSNGSGGASSSGPSTPAFRRVVRYFYDPLKTNTDHVNEIVILGKSYDPKVRPKGPEEIINTDGDGYSTRWPDGFLQDVNTRVWITYRKGFALIPRARNGPSTISLGGILRGSGIDLNGFTSDVGWGCMIRTAQGLLANALVMLKLGRDWRRQEQEQEQDQDHNQKKETEADIIKWFTDEPESQFSLHRFVEHGEKYCGKMPGEWFGPSAAASSIRALCQQSGVLKAYIGEGSDIYEDQLRKQATNEETGLFEPILVLLGIRLGIDQVNPVYWESLKQLLAYPQAVGIAGGRPSSSHYFFGYQNNDLFYLDPHVTKPALKTENLPRALETVHTTEVRTLNLKEMDPSMLIGFLIKDEKDWEDWKLRVSEIESRSIINISPSEPVIRCQSTISVGSDQDEAEFIDVGFENGKVVTSDRDMDHDDNADLEGSMLFSSKETIDDSYCNAAPTTNDSSLCHINDSDTEVQSTGQQREEEYDDPVMIDTSEMLSGSNNSSYVEPSYIEYPGLDHSISELSGRHDDDEWEDMDVEPKLK